MVKVTITRYRKGRLSVPKLYCPDLDTLSGNMTIQRAGATVLMLDGSNIHCYDDIRLLLGEDIKDNSYAIVLASDGSGHIDGLGRIDAKITTDPILDIRAVRPLDVSHYNNGGVENADMTWTANSTGDKLVIALSDLLPQSEIGARVHIDSINITLNTTNNGAYVTSLTVNEINHFTNASVQLDQDPTDIGNGITGDTFGTWAIETALANNRIYELVIDTVIGAGTLKIHAISITYHRI